MAEKGAAATQTARESVSVKESVPVKAPVAPNESNELIERFNKAYEEIANRAFGIFENDGRIMGRDLEHWFKAETELFHPVHINVAETEGTAIDHQWQERNERRNQTGQDGLQRAVLE